MKHGRKLFALEEGEPHFSFWTIQLDAPTKWTKIIEETVVHYRASPLSLHGNILLTIYQFQWQ
ncbi:hypothetical protein KY289_019683 [Solanum tuberosum]|nr:hypothetical protein KY284_019459 [Solanum tuberosum]KAH0681931.1 hypothetical protein KY289_019683 [Solanum tuberosum]